MLSKKGRSFQQAEGRHGTRKLWRQRIRTVRRALLQIILDNRVVFQDGLWMEY